MKINRYITKCNLMTSWLLILVITSCHPQNNETSNANSEVEHSFNEWYLPTYDNEANLFIKEVGKGEPVILMHGGFGNDHTGVIGASKGLEDKYKFIFYDQRGSSLSYCEESVITVDNHLRDLETLRKALNIERLTLVTHSASTIIAFLYLEKYPNNVKNVILLGAMHPKNGKREYFTEQEWKRFDNQKEVVEKFVTRPNVEEEIIKEGLNIEGKTAKQKAKYRHIKYYAANNIYHIEKWRELSVPHWSRVAAQAASQSFNWDYNYTVMLSQLKTPITVINGEYDYVVGAKGSPIWKSVADKAKNIELFSIGKSGHLPWIDAPKRFKFLFLKALEKK